MTAHIKQNFTPLINPLIRRSFHFNRNIHHLSPKTVKYKIKKVISCIENFWYPNISQSISKPPTKFLVHIIGSNFFNNPLILFLSSICNNNNIIYKHKLKFQNGCRFLGKLISFSLISISNRNLYKVLNLL